MKKKIISVFALFLVSILILSSCAASVKNESAMDSLGMSGGASADGFRDYDTKFDNGFVYESESATSDSLAPGTAGTIVVNTERKIIYSSWYNLQTTEYDKSVAALLELCTNFGAYFESSNEYGATSYGQNRNSHYVIRIPVENYTSFTQGVASVGTVVSSGNNNRDITEQYIDTEARLESAKLREERLLEILAAAKSLDDVLALERELSDVRYEIESYSGTIKKYDSQVSFATCEVSINEVIRVTPAQEYPKTFGDRISQSFKDGLENYFEGLKDMIVGLSYHITNILLVWVPVIIIAAVIIVFAKKKKTAKKVKKIKQEQNTENEEK